jgi:hypothetical protein
LRALDLLAEKLGYGVEEVAEIRESDLPSPGLEREALVKIRVNQSFFRNRVLSGTGFVAVLPG